MRNRPNIIPESCSSVVTALSQIRAVKGVLCFGSYAQGTCDEKSDIDLFILSSPNIVPRDERRRVLEELDGVSGFRQDPGELGGADRRFLDEDRFRLQDHGFDLLYAAMDWLTAVLQKVTEDGATSVPEVPFRCYTLAGLLERSIILYDPESEVSDLKAGLYPYPSALKRAILAEHVPVLRESVGELLDYAGRNIGNTAFHFHLGRVLDSLEEVLFAVNERYNPATKRVEAAYGELEALPQRFVQRYEFLLETPFTPEGKVRIAEGFREIVQEVEVLIEGRRQRETP